jgi:phosphatidate cytidylyltransferase
LRREITGFIALILFLVCVLWSYGIWLTVVVASAAFFFAHEEIYNLFSIPRSLPLIFWQNLLAVLFLVCAVLHMVPSLLIITFLFFWGSCLISMSKAVKGSRYEIAIHGLLFIYLLLPIACFVYLRSLEHGPALLFFTLSVACLTDTGAYYGGKLLGKHKLAPILSPNKTWEGAIAGAALTTAIILITAYGYSIFKGNTLWLSGPHQYGHIIILTIFLSAVGQVGDLCESAMKRDAGIKDSGTMDTGHGGFLDMMDSMLWIGPAMFVYSILFCYSG